MNQLYFRSLLYISITVAAALFLSSCESGDSSGLSQDIQYVRQSKLIEKHQLDDLRIVPTNLNADNKLTLTTTQQQQLTVYGVKDKQDVLDLTNELSWSSDSVKASIDSRGMLVGYEDGDVKITANLASITKELNVKLSSAPLERIEIIAVNETGNFTVDVCDELSLRAGGIYEQEEEDVRDLSLAVSWEINITDKKIAVIGVGANTATLKASNTLEDGELEVTATVAGVNVEPATQPVTIGTYSGGAITVSSSRGEINKGQTLAFRAVTGNPERDISKYVAWTSSEGSVADFIQKEDAERNIITAVDNGITNITASCGATDSVPLPFQVSDISIVSSSFRFEGQSSDIDRSKGVSLSLGESKKLTYYVTYSNGDKENRSSDATWTESGWSKDAISIVVSDSEDNYVEIISNGVADSGNIIATIGEVEKSLEINIQ